MKLKKEMKLKGTQLTTLVIDGIKNIVVVRSNIFELKLPISDVAIQRLFPRIQILRMLQEFAVFRTTLCMHKNVLVTK